MSHECLSIVDPQSGGQPLKSIEGEIILAVNGEIYNHREIRDRFVGKYNFQTGSDREVIIALYKEKGINFLEELNGIFAVALYDAEKDFFIVARDHIDIIPLYMGNDSKCKSIEPFPPGYYITSNNPTPVQGYLFFDTQYLFSTYPCSRITRFYC